MRSPLSQITPGGLAHEGHIWQPSQESGCAFNVQGFLICPSQEHAGVFQGSREGSLSWKRKGSPADPGPNTNKSSSKLKVPLGCDPWEPPRLGVPRPFTHGPECPARAFPLTPSCCIPARRLSDWAPLFLGTPKGSFCFPSSKDLRHFQKVSF